MKTSSWVTFGICLLALVLIGGNWLGLIPSVRVGSTQSLNYIDLYDGVSFSYTEDLAIQDISQSNEKIRILNVMPKNLKNKFDPQFIEIITYNLPTESLKESALDFLPDANEEDLISVDGGNLEAVEYSQIKGVGEESLYTFFTNGEQLSIVIFRMRRFDKTNPLVLVDNSRYLSSYREIVNTFEME